MTEFSGSLTPAFLAESSKKYELKPERLLTDSIVKNGLDNTSIRQVAISKMSHIFSNQVEPMEITNQKKSGRCWIFAGMNLLRYALNEKCGIKNPDFELSQSYMMFWDKLEKANYFLESIIDTADQDKGSRLIMWLFGNMLNDGGQWDMLVSLIEKYGVIPKYAMPESFHSSNSSKMNALLKRKLRIDAITLRGMKEKGETNEALRAEKEKMMAEIYGLLCAILGEPPRSFDFTYRDKENTFHRDADITPIDFFKKYWGEDYLDRFVSVINAPTGDKPYGRTYTVKYLGNVVGGKPVTYLNLPSECLEKAAAAQIKDGEPVWFGSDVGQYSEREMGIMDTDLFSYDKVLGTSLAMSKADMLDYGESFLTHAMMLLRVDENESGIQKWKVENSWGKDVGEKGFFVMSNGWFKEYVCQVVVEKKYLTPEQLMALEQKPIELEPWDPIGSLAD